MPRLPFGPAMLGAHRCHQCGAPIQVTQLPGYASVIRSCEVTCKGTIKLAGELASIAVELPSYVRSATFTWWMEDPAPAPVPAPTPTPPPAPPEPPPAPEPVVVDVADGDRVSDDPLHLDCGEEKTKTN